PRVTALEAAHDAERLGVVAESAVLGEAAVERALAGVPERRMPEVVGERGGFRQVLVEAERARERAGDLRDLERMGEPGAVVVALVRNEHLGLVGEPAERGRMDDAVAVAAGIAARRARRLGVQAPAAALRIGRIGSARARCGYRHERRNPWSG